MKKFEYTYFDQANGINPDSIYELDELGEQGWELVAIRKSDSTVGGYKFYFKKEIEEKKCEGFCIECGDLIPMRISCDSCIEHNKKKQS